jgi:hypothetical protein
MTALFDFFIQLTGQSRQVVMGIEQALLTFERLNIDGSRRAVLGAALAGAVPVVKAVSVVVIIRPGGGC